MALHFSPKRLVFDLNNELIQKLLYIFGNTDYPFIPKEYGTNGLAVPFPHLPTITLSDKRPKATDEVIGINDLLGAYIMKDWDTKEEGTVVMYHEAIWDAVVDYKASDTSIVCTTEECFDALVSIVAVHEFVHWKMHYYVGFAPLKYETADEISFHEGIAQLITWQVIKKVAQEGYKYGQLVSDLFLWLADRQPKAYRMYKVIKEADEDGKIIRYRELFKLLKWFKVARLQSFEAIKPFLKMINLQEGERLAEDDADVDDWVAFYNKNYFDKEFNEILYCIFKGLPLATIENHQLKPRYAVKKFSFLPTKATQK